MKSVCHCILRLATLVLPLSMSAQPVVTNCTTSEYAVVPDPLGLAFGGDGALYCGRDHSGSGGGNADAVKIHRVAPGGTAVTEFGVAALPDPDALTVDTTGAVSGLAGAVLVGGQVSPGNPPVGKVSRVAPDGTVTDLFGPSDLYSNPSAFTFDAAGRLLFSDSAVGRVYRVDGGAPALLFSLSDTYALVCDTTDRVVVGLGNAGRLLLYTSDGGLANANWAAVRAGTPLARGPGGVWTTEVYAIEAGGALIRLALDGTVTTVGSGFVDVEGLAFGPDGALYASEFNRDVVWRIAPRSCLPAPAGLMGWWPGDGDTRDIQGQNPAQGLGGLGYAPGEVGEAFDLDGTSQHAQVAAPVGLPLGNAPRTLSLWLRLTRGFAQTTESGIFQYGSNADGQMFGLITSANASGRLYFFGHNADLAGSTVLQVGSWYHAAVTHDGTTVKLYVNGQPEGSRTAALNTTLNADGVTIGLRPPSTRWQGQLDEIMLFDRALTGEEVAAIYAAGSGGVCRPVTAVTVAWTFAGGQLRLGWPSETGVPYQLQSSPDVSGGVWLDEGSPLVGTGGVLTLDVPSNLAARFFRLRIGR